MPVQIPGSVSEQLAAIEHDVRPIKDYEVGSRLSRLHQAEGLTHEERRGAWAEASAFNFMAMSTVEESVWDTHFGPVFQATRANGTSIQSPDIKDIDAEILAYWEQRAKATPHPVLRARYADLIWDLQYLVSQQKPSVEFARAAIDAYVETIDHELYDEPMIGIGNAERALELALRINDKTRIELVRQAMFRLYGQVAKPALAGTWAFLFDSLYNNNRVPLAPGQEQRIIDLLEETLRYCSDEANKDEFNPWAAKNAGERLAGHYQRIGRRDEVERVIRAYGGAFEKISAKADGLLGMTSLHMLSEDYRRHGLVADAERVQTAGTGKGRQGPTEMKTVEVVVTIERERIEAYLNAITDGTVLETLSRIATHFVPRANEAREALKSIEKEHPLMALIGIERISEGHISARAGSIHEDPDGRLYFQLAESMAYQAPFLRSTIDRAKTRHKLNVDHLIDFLYHSPLFEEGRRDLLRHGLVAYFAEDYVTAIHVLVPQIEQALRVLLGLLGVPTNKPHRGVMQVKNLNDILREPAIRAVLGEDIQLYLVVFLADSRGHNVRNEVFHGLLAAEAFRADVADRVLHCLVTLGLTRRKGQEE